MKTNWFIAFVLSVAALSICTVSGAITGYHHLSRVEPSVGKWGGAVGHQYYWVESPDISTLSNVPEGVEWLFVVNCPRLKKATVSNKVKTLVMYQCHQFVCLEGGDSVEVANLEDLPALSTVTLSQNARDVQIANLPALTDLTAPGAENVCLAVLPKLTNFSLSPKAKLINIDDCGPNQLTVPDGAEIFHLSGSPSLRKLSVPESAKCDISGWTPQTPWTFTTRGYIRWPGISKKTSPLH